MIGILLCPSPTALSRGQRYIYIVLSSVFANTELAVGTVVLPGEKRLCVLCVYIRNFQEGLKLGCYH